jgi:cytohesin
MAEIPEHLNAWHYASFGELDALKQLKEEGGDIDGSDDRGFTPLAWAARNGHEEVVTLLVESECNLESSCFGGLKPLHHAVNKNLERVAKMLIKAGSDVNAVDDNMDTVLHYASSRGVLNIVVALLAGDGNGGADVLRTNAQGVSVLHKACMFGQLAITKKLCDVGGDMAAQDSVGETPMHYAAKSGFPAIVKYLIEKGAPIDVANSAGMTPKQVAVNAATKGAFPED